MILFIHLHWNLNTMITAYINPVQMCNMHVDGRDKIKFLSHAIHLTIKLTMVTIYYHPIYYFPTRVLHSCAYSGLFTPQYISGSWIYVLHCLSLYKHISGCYGAPLYERRGALWGGVSIVYHCAWCARSRVPWKRSGSNKSNLRWWRTLSRLMFWNKRFKAMVWTICEVNLGIYGQLLKLKAFP